MCSGPKCRVILVRRPYYHRLTVLQCYHRLRALLHLRPIKEAPLYTRYLLEALNSTLRRKADASSVDQWLGRRKRTKSTRVKTSKLEDAAAFAFWWHFPSNLSFVTATLRTDFFFLPLFLPPFSFSPFFTRYLFVRQRWGSTGLSHILVRFLACVLGQRTSVVPYKGQNLITSGEVLLAIYLSSIII